MKKLSGRTVVVLLGATTVLFYVCSTVFRHTAVVVRAQNLLPLWDPATHSLYGWQMYDSLKTLNLPMFLWEVWSKGLWPFMFYLYQVPFYFVAHHQFEGTLVSSTVAFMAVGVVSTFLLMRLGQLTHGPISAGVFVLFLVSSPFYLAFSSLAMTEMFGVLMQLIVLTTYSLGRESNSRPLAIAFAVSLTLLFFTKYNYFLLVSIPIAIHEYFCAMPRPTTMKHHFHTVWGAMKRLLQTLPGRIVVGFAAFLGAIVLTGGFGFQFLSHQVSVESVGNSGYLVLYLLLINLWLRHRRKQIDWAKILAADVRIRPLLVYFVFPVVVWFAIPHPNHIKEFFAFLVNRSSSDQTVLSSIGFYSSILRRDYFMNDLMFGGGLLVLVIALLRYRHQTGFMRFLLIATVVQLLLTMVHPYKEARFILTALLPLWLVIALELTHWLTRVVGSNRTADAVAAVIGGLAVLSFGSAVENPAFARYAFNLYIDQPQVGECYSWVRQELPRDARLAIAGGVSNWFSPALNEWELGNPRGYSNFIGNISPDQREKLSHATHLLVISPSGTAAGEELINSHQKQIDRIEELQRGGKIALLGESDVADAGFRFVLYRVASGDLKL